MVDQQLDDDDVNQRFYKMDNNSSRSKSFVLIQIVLMVVIASPFVAIFSGIFLAIFFSMWHIHFDIGSYFSLFLFASALILFLIVIYYFIFVIIFVIMTSISYKRTKYIGFLYESLIEIQILIFPLLAIFLYAYYNQDLFFELLFLLLISLEYKFVKKPLIYGLKYQTWPFDTNNDSRDIVSHQSVFINNFEDGYSSRPVTENIKDILSNAPNSNIKKNLEDFANFLAINGDLINYSIDDKKLRMYLRTRFIQKTQIFNPILMIKKFNQFINKEELTSVIIDLESVEISFKLNKYDYGIMNNISYYQLSERILQQFKKSIKNFLAEKYQDSYEEVNPDVKVKKPVILTDKPRVFIIIGYIVGACIFTPLLLLISGPASFTVFALQNNYWFLIILFWPMFLYLYFEDLANSYQGNYQLLISQNLNALILIVSVVIISLIITTIIFYILYKHEIKVLHQKTHKLKSFDYTRIDI